MISIIVELIICMIVLELSIRFDLITGRQHYAVKEFVTNDIISKLVLCVFSLMKFNLLVKAIEVASFLKEI